MLDRPISERPGLTVRDVVADVVASIETEGSSFDVADVLQTQGHSWRTIETVLAYLNADLEVTS